MRLSFDVGGTFTDFVLVDDQTEDVVVYKQLTTPLDPTLAAFEGMQHLLRVHAAAASSVKIVIHGTTLVANALIERRGATVALVTSRGTRDVLAIGTEDRYDINDRALVRPQPLVPRTHIVEVNERVDKTGSSVSVFNPSEAGDAVDSLVAAGIDAIAVCLLHAYAYPAHEQRLRDVFEERFPGLDVSLSSEVAPEMREYSRMSTTVANAYVLPKVRAYVTKLARNLESIGYQKGLFFMLSDGGIADSALASRLPIRLVESGPAGGAQAAAGYARALGLDHVLSFDMGGTTAKLCVVDDGEPQRASSLEVARVHRFKKGSGLPLVIPVIELLEIGAGGGSISHIDDLGLLKVGPTSAGSDPGPACYGNGGQLPTVTDAALVLGYLDPTYFLGGRLRLDPDAAHRALLAHAGGPLGVDAVRAAAGIFQVATQNMADAARVYLAELGKDIRGYTLFAFGGAGPVHACQLARTLKITNVVVPYDAGVTSAVGFLAAPPALDYAKTYLKSLDQLDILELAAVYEQMLIGNSDILERAGLSSDAEHERWADMHYTSQSHEISVRLDDVLSSSAPTALRDAFDRRYRDLYGHTLPDRGVAIRRCRLRVQGPRPPFLTPRKPARAKAVREAEHFRDVHFGESGFLRCPILRRSALAEGDAVEGPAVIQEENSTTVLDGDWRATVDEFGNLRISVS